MKKEKNNIYIDIDTGEKIKFREIQKQNYIIIKKINYAIKKTNVYECRRQPGLEFK